MTCLTNQQGHRSHHHRPHHRWLSPARKRNSSSAMVARGSRRPGGQQRASISTLPSRKKRLNPLCRQGISECFKTLLTPYKPCAEGSHDQGLSSARSFFLRTTTCSVEENATNISLSKVENEELKMLRLKVKRYLRGWIIKTQEEIKEYLDYLKKLQFIRPGTRNL